MSRTLAADATLSQDPSPRHLPALDGLRGLAALAVVLGHMPEFGFANWLADNAKDYGVELFFVLSGFLMGHLYLRRGWTLTSAWSFSVARIARIIPIYFVVVAVSFLLFHTILPHFVYDVSTRQLVRLLTFNGSVSIFWSVGPEFQFYVVFVALWWAWDRRSLRPWSVAAAAAMCTAGIAFNKYLPGIIFLSKAHIFLFGVAAAVVLGWLWGRPGLAWLKPIAQVVAVLSLIVIAVSNPWIGQLNHALVSSSDAKLSAFYGSAGVAAWMAAIVLSLAWGGRVVNMLFSNRFFVLLGEVSFSLYLLHDAVLWALQTNGLVAQLGKPAASALALLLCLGIATASHRWLEMPSRSYLRQRLSTATNGRPPKAL